MINKKICLIGQPNVGKSSLFNLLTNSHHHTGNWTGKTISKASGIFKNEEMKLEIVDLPGTYSLIGESEEEKITNNYIYSSNYDLGLVIIDASNLERSLPLLLEVLNINSNVIVCLNLYDEAKLRNIKINHQKLSKILKIPVILMSVKNNEGIDILLEEIKKFSSPKQYQLSFPNNIDKYLNFMQDNFLDQLNPRAYALKLLIDDEQLDQVNSKKITNQIKFFQKQITKEDIINCFLMESQKIADVVVQRNNEKAKKLDYYLDKLLINKITAIPLMLFLLFIILWLTISLSNLPSNWLFSLFQFLEPKLYNLLSFLPQSLLNPLVYGGYRTLYWVVSVMTPPMIIFFPLFSLLEDFGILPRIAFNLDHPFNRCGSCGKQSLTMCMGLGCNAVGVTSARIMENKKMKILSIITNVFMPCNGRFPAMISIITMFFLFANGIFNTLIASLILTMVIVFGIFLTFIVTKICNYVFFKNEHVVFVLELPSYRKPNIIKTIYTSIKDKALDILKRAIKISFPAGLIIYFLANYTINNTSLFTILADFLNDFGLLIGLDGVILLAFILGIPANEIVIPIIILGYTKTSSLIGYDSLESLKNTLVNNNWTILTAINFLIFSLCHFPCATTLLTIKEETKSYKWTLLSFILPVIIGVLLCFITTFIFC